MGRSFRQQRPVLGVHLASSWERRRIASDRCRGLERAALKTRQLVSYQPARIGTALSAQERAVADVASSASTERQRKHKPALIEARARETHQPIAASETSSRAQDVRFGRRADGEAYTSLARSLVSSHGSLQHADAWQVRRCICSE